jgi:hypothetical protein
VKTTRSSNQRQYTIELPDEGMVDDMVPSTERRCPINRNNENAKVINIDVSDVIKLLKYMHAGISRFFKPNNIYEKMVSILIEIQCQKRNTVTKRNTSKTVKQNTFLNG